MEHKDGLIKSQLFVEKCEFLKINNQVVKETLYYEKMSSQSEDIYRFRGHIFMDIHINNFCASDQ